MLDITNLLTKLSSWPLGLEYLNGYHRFNFQVWNLTNCKLKKNHYGHSGYLNTVTVSPDGSLCASGGKVSIE